MRESKGGKVLPPWKYILLCVTLTTNLNKHVVVAMQQIRDEVLCQFQQLAILLTHHWTPFQSFAVPTLLLHVFILSVYDKSRAGTTSKSMALLLLLRNSSCERRITEKIPRIQFAEFDCHLVEDIKWCISPKQKVTPGFPLPMKWWEIRAHDHSTSIHPQIVEWAMNCASWFVDSVTWRNVLIQQNHEMCCRKIATRAYYRCTQRRRFCTLFLVIQFFLLFSCCAVSALSSFQLFVEQSTSKHVPQKNREFEDYCCFVVMCKREKNERDSPGKIPAFAPFPFGIVVLAIGEVPLTSRNLSCAMTWTECHTQLWYKMNSW